MNWTDERVELLKKLWAEGLSASQIAAQLGNVSRNAVIGKVHRLKLSSRGRATAAPAAKKKIAATAAPAQRTVTAAPRPATTSQPPRIVSSTAGANALQMQFDAEPAANQQTRSASDVVVPISRRLHLVELSERTCKWPNGDPLSEDFSFCGHEATDASPYCSYHAKVAFQPVGERRRAR
ncbi:GcrA family cell cycle regulator [Tianweitania sp. BSSL-BM11]|uniref:GcrA family cell cycle regulator n=1 Tax=Tianweitania aestuarii TaxID=2814886 RepID=A0ABS5RQE8_9HYPH|nr:GcrA family cell cycle regulator [Tianweitania aestuarii]MBS9719263.1 GcrA family cell cycle regulator [Tianweitania aestuarii]